MPTATTNTIVTSVRDEVIKLAQSQIGYKETGTNNTKYNRYFDVEAWQFFNTKKQGAAWCATFVIWLFVQVLLPLMGKSFAKIRTWFGMPSPANNCAAGCPYFFKYMKSRGWQVDKRSGLPGDIIFFNSSCSHVGIIEKVDANKYYTIEGNKSNMVKRCLYSRTSSSIYGIMRPDYASVDPEPQPVPPTPPAPTTVTYTVKTSGDALRLRAEPNTSSKQIGYINNGTKFQSDKVVKGQNIGGVDTWVYYKGGYASGKYLSPTPVVTTTTEPTPAPLPIPEPKPAKPVYKKYKTTAKHGLNVRRGPGMGYGVVKCLSYGTTVTVYETKNGWGRIGSSQWCSKTYLKAI